MKSRKPSRRLAIVGCGAIGSLVARSLEKRKSSFRIMAVFDTFLSSSTKLSQSLKSKPKVCRELKQIFPLCDWVLEAGSVQAALQVAEAALLHKKPVILMSTGGFLLNQKKLTGLANRQRTKIYLPSGALCGLDGLKSARQMGALRKLEITSTKPPRGFQGAPGLTAAQRKALSGGKTKLTLYNGDVWGAIRRFPANVNVAATTALASGAPRKLRVRVLADPGAKLNQHEIHAKGEFGELTAVTRNRPSRMNPKTSALAIQSALALFERLESHVEVGN
ncbi:MAG TPA: aspartate dehydrogenase domain-containing protein [bacterium]|nr:aspartate dehydrogenase domain-containing protein [bacterium]